MTTALGVYIAMYQWMITLVCVSVAAAQDWDLVWSDEFNGPDIDLTKWEHEVTAGGGGVGEQQNCEVTSLK